MDTKRCPLIAGPKNIEKPTSWDDTAQPGVCAGEPAFEPKLNGEDHFAELRAGFEVSVGGGGIA